MSTSQPTVKTTNAAEVNWRKWPEWTGWWWLDDGRDVVPVYVEEVAWHPSRLFPSYRGQPLAGGQSSGQWWFTPAVAPDNSPAQQELPW